MKNIAIGTLSALLICGAVSISFAEENLGKQVFLNSGCVNCHSVSAKGIEGKGTVNAPDLSSVGKKHDGAFILKYLRKKIELNDKKHRKKFRGSKDDFMKLREWLLTLK